MAYLYILIYFLGAVMTGLWVYISLIKKYKKENTALKFGVWIESYCSTILFSTIFWFIALPIWIIIYLINRIIERINKHYNIK